MNKVLKQLMRSKVVSVDTETATSDPTDKKGALKPKRCLLRGVSMAWYDKAGRKRSHYWSFDPTEMPPQEAASRWRRFKRDILDPFARRRRVIVVMHNAPFDVQVLRARGVVFRGRIADTLILSYLIDENLPHDLKSCARRTLGAEDALSHKKTAEKVEEIVTTAQAKAKALAQAAWEVYRDYHKGDLSDDDLDRLPRVLRSIILETPAKTLKKKVMEAAWERRGAALVEKARRKAIRLFHEYARKDALWTLGLYEAYLPRVQELGFGALYWLLYMKVLARTTEMEWRGVRVDIPKLKKILAMVDERIEEVQATLDERFGEGFNANSSPQVKDLMWNKWGLEPPPWLNAKKDYGKDGLPSSREEIIEWMVEFRGEKRLESILAFRKLTKLKSTYLVPLIKEAEADPEGRVHTSFSITKVTSRWSSSRPNLQNIPNHATLLKYIPGVESIRSCFIAAPGKKLIVADYSQIDLRVMTHYSRDPAFLKAYRTWKCPSCKMKGETAKSLHACPNCGEQDKDGGGKFVVGADVHAETGKSTGLIKKYGKKEGRRKSKPVNFGACYLMGYNTLSQQTGLAPAEAKVVLEAYHHEHPGIRRLADHLEAQIFAYGYFRLLNGQMRRFDRELKVIRTYKKKGGKEAEKQAWWRTAALIREAMNNTGQGGAAVIINTAVLDFHLRAEEMEERSLELLLQVHDELMFEVDEDKAEEQKTWVRDRMEAAGHLCVPVLAASAIGDNWEEAK